MKRDRSPSASGRSRDKQSKRLALFRQIMRAPWAVEAACREYFAGQPRRHDFAETRKARLRRQERRFVARANIEALS